MPMDIPAEIAYRNVQKSDEIDTLIRDEIAKLDAQCDRLGSCRVVVEQPQRHQNTGSPYAIRIAMHVPPGHELVVRRNSAAGDMHTSLEAVIADAFEAAGRQLRKQQEQVRGRTKHHPQQETMAFISKLFPDDGYGFLETRDGRELYFHRNTVLHDDFGRLAVGTGVRFAEEMGEKGPQATTVQIVDKPGSRIAGSERPDLPEV